MPLDMRGIAKTPSVNHPLT